MGSGELWKIMMDIATWARENFGKSLSLNTDRHCIKKCNLKLYYLKRKASINYVQKCHQVLWAQSNLRWTERQWKCVLWSDESTFQLVLGENGRRILCAKGVKDHPTATLSQSLQEIATIVSAISPPNKPVQTLGYTRVNRVLLWCQAHFVTVALGTKRRPGIRQNRRRLFNAESRKPV